MDGSRFDDLARSLARRRPTRRSLLRAVAGTLAGGAGVLLGGGGAFAKKTCEEVPGQTTCGNRCCKAAQECCGTQCVDLSHDAKNCGDCGVACPHGQHCTEGTCACPGNHVACHGACVSPATFAHDPANCGTCGHRCGAGQACRGAVCVCRHGLAACGQACCRDDEACADGRCVCAAAGQTRCRGGCVDLANDPRHCGACDNDCLRSPFDGGVGPGGLCVRGACACPPGGGCSEDVTCIAPDQTVTTQGTCCSYPQVSQCCTESSPGAKDGFAHCCTWGVDCITACPGLANGATGGEVSCCDNSCRPDGGVVHACFVNGEACGDWPCCGGYCNAATNTCTCSPSGHACTLDAVCCSGRCQDGVCACPGGGQACPDGNCCDGFDCAGGLCCGLAGSACFDNAGCCGSLACHDGVCAVTANV